MPCLKPSLRKGQNYVLRVNGHSMIDDGIHDGDYVVVNRREKAANGEMVAALVNGEATLKRFYLEETGASASSPRTTACRRSTRPRATKVQAPSWA